MKRERTFHRNPVTFIFLPYKKRVFFSVFDKKKNIYKLLLPLAIMAEGPHPFPSRTRSLSPPAPMVLFTRVNGRVGVARGIFYSFFMFLQ